MDRPPGVEFHTFTIVGRCERTGMFGIATATRSLAVGARVPHVKSQTGAVAIMAIADPRLGAAALQFLEQGYKAPTVIDQLVAMDPYAEYRQAIIDAGIKIVETAGNKPAVWSNGPDGQEGTDDDIGNWLQNL